MYPHNVINLNPPHDISASKALEWNIQLLIHYYYQLVSLKHVHDVAMRKIRTTKKYRTFSGIPDIKKNIAVFFL